MKTIPCKGCGRPIVFAVTDDGKRIPLDSSAPVYMVTGWDGDGPTTIERSRMHFVSHFSTCRALDKGWRPRPQEDRWTNKRPSD